MRIRLTRWERTFFSSLLSLSAHAASTAWGVSLGWAARDFRKVWSCKFDLKGSFIHDSAIELSFRESVAVDICQMTKHRVKLWLIFGHIAIVLLVLFVKHRRRDMHWVHSGRVQFYPWLYHYSPTRIMISTITPLLFRDNQGRYWSFHNTPFPKLVC